MRTHATSAAPAAAREILPSSLIGVGAYPTGVRLNTLRV